MCWVEVYWSSTTVWRHQCTQIFALGVSESLTRSRNRKSACRPRTHVDEGRDVTMMFIERRSRYFQAVWPFGLKINPRLGWVRLSRVSNLMTKYNRFLIYLFICLFVCLFVNLFLCLFKIKTNGQKRATNMSTANDTKYALQNPTSPL